MGPKGEARVREERGKTVHPGKQERHSRQEPPAKEVVKGVGWIGRRKDSHRPRTDAVKQVVQQLGDRRRSGDGGKKAGSTVAEMAKIIDDMEKIDQTLERMAKRVNELEREESAKMAVRQQRQRQAGKEPKRKSILKHEAQAKSDPAPPTEEEKPEEAGQGAPQEHVETMVSIVVEAVHKVVDEVMHNVIEKMVTDEKMMMQDDHMAADVVEKLGQMMKGDGDRHLARPSVRERLLQAEKKEQQKMEEVTGIKEAGWTSFVEPYLTGSTGDKPTEYKNSEVAVLEGIQGTSHQRDEVTSFQGDEVTSFQGDWVTNFQRDDVTSFQEGWVANFLGDRITDLQGHEVTSLQVDEVTSFQGSEVTSLQGSEVTSVQGDEVTSLYGDEVTSLQESEVTSVQGDEVTSLRGDEVTSLQGSEVTSVQGDEVTSLRGDEVTSLEGSEITSVQGDEVTSLQGYDVISLQGSDVTSPQGDKVPSHQGNEVTSHQGNEVTSHQGAAVIILQTDEVTELEGAAVIILRGDEVTEAEGDEVTSNHLPEALEEAARASEEKIPKDSVGDAKEGTPKEQLVKDGHKRSVERPRAQAAKDVVDALRQVFLVLCEMAEGEFDIQAFRSILQRLRLQLSEEAIGQAFRKLDGNEDQHVTFEDFLRAMTDDRLFVRFMAGLPDTCCDSKMQKGFLDNRVFFQVLSTLLRSQSLSEGATAVLIDYYYRKKKGAKLKSRKAGEAGHPTAQSFLGVSVFNLIHYLDILEPDMVYKEQPLTPQQSQALTEAFEAFDRNERGNVDQSTLLSTMDRLKLGLGNPFIPDDRKMAAVNAGKELTFHDFLGIMVDTGTFGKYLDPPEAGRERHRAPETLSFEILLENLETSTIDCDTRRILIDYYRTKYRRLEARVLELNHRCQARGRERTMPTATGDRMPLAPRPKASLKQQQPPEDYRPGAGQTPKPAGDAATRRRGDREGPAANRPAPSSTETKAKPAAAGSHTLQKPDRVSNTRRGQNRSPENRPAANDAHGYESNPGPTPKPKEQ